MGTNNEEKRARTWVLIQATDQEKVVNKVRQLDKRLKELVVIRVDLVDGGDPNIVASIDVALDNDKYEQTKTAIRAIKEITNVRFLKVTKHNPELPHNASGYVTKYEAKHPNSEKKDVKVGRQDNSPGFNPWG